jgi:hypothetical protein
MAEADLVTDNGGHWHAILLELHYLKQLCMPLKAPSPKPKTARRTGSMPVNPSSDPSVTLPNVHVKTSSSKIAMRDP